LQYVFDNYKLNRSITVNGAPPRYYGFGMSTSNPIRYFVTHNQENKIYAFDEEWNYVSENIFTRPLFMISVGNSFYITGDHNIWKTNQQLNLLIEYTESSHNYNGLYYNSTNDLIYVTVPDLYEIHVFNLNLTFNHNISTPYDYDYGYKPWSINGYNNKVYVGTYSGTILEIVNNQTTNQFFGCNDQLPQVDSIPILFDQFDNLATACIYLQVSNNYSQVSNLYLYNKNGSYLNKNISLNERCLFIGFDSISRLVVVLNSQITIYN
jgi:hypothetical protein